MRLNFLDLSTYGGAVADPEYFRMVAPQFEPKKKVANLFVRLRLRASEQINAHDVTIRWTLLWPSGSFFLEYSFPGKVGADLGEENPITSIRWTTKFVRVRRISDLYNPT